MLFKLEWIDQNLLEVHSARYVASGGQKTVFLVEHPNTGTNVLKIFHPQQDAIDIEREVLAVSAVKSARVPPIYEQGVMSSPLGQCLWLRERYIEGHSLRSVLATAPLPLEAAMRLARHILEALSSAEHVSIVHRDVKPDNVIQDVFGDYWLIDFGIARHLELTSLTATESLFGKLTLGYAPVEQMRNQKSDIDSRSDLFALGVMLIECITGAHPFRDPPAANALEVVRRVERLDFKADFGSSQVCRAFSDFVNTLIQKRRVLRPRSAHDALTWLEEFS